MKPSRLLIALVLFNTVAAFAAADIEWNRVFNWTPSGQINVGDRSSEGPAAFESDGALITADLAYRGAQPTNVQGRNGTTDSFVIQPASWRGGVAVANLAILRTIDTAATPVELTVTVEGKPAGKWLIQPPDGPRRLYDALYVIPRTLFADGKPPAQVHVTMTSETPLPTFGYRFYATRDWDLLAVGDAHGLDGMLEGAGPIETAYLNGLRAAGDHDWLAAFDQFRTAEQLAAQANKDELARLARVAQRRTKLRIAQMETAANFTAHYQLGLLAGAWQCWDIALEEFQQAQQLNPADADNTYRLAEAMEYNRLPIAEWAPLMERAGMLGDRGDCNVEDVLMAVHVPAQEGICGILTATDLAAIQRDWRHVEQQVYGASGGAWKLRTHYYFSRENDPAWVMQAGWIFLPPDSYADYTGQYQYTIGTSNFGWSHAGGVDCGTAGSGGADIGALRSWEVFIHEWNHEFDWVNVFSEVAAGYPVTHDSDGCGKQPIVNMGCGHRSSMRYYLNRAQYQRHRASDRVNPEAFIKNWSTTIGHTAPEFLAGTTEEIEQWLVGSRFITADELEAWRRDWQNARKEAEQRAANPPLVASEPPRQDPPDWVGYMKQRWEAIPIMDELSLPQEQEFVSGAPVRTTIDIPPSSVTPNFIDANLVLPPDDKMVGAFRTYLYSPSDQDVRLWVGYNDCAKVWLNGREILHGNYFAQAKWADENRPYMLAAAGQLKEGWNCVAFKLERRGGKCGFSLHVTDYDNNAITGLRSLAALPDGATVAQYTPPPAGQFYRWSAVQDDYLELLPRLTDADLAALTGIAGLSCDAHEFHLVLPEGTSPVAGSRYTADPDPLNRTLDNFLNWDFEAAAALRYEKDGKPRDLLLIRPEYFTEYLTLLKEQGPLPGSTPNRVLGYLFLDQAEYPSTPNHSARAALVVETFLGDYPQDDLDLLGVK